MTSAADPEQTAPPPAESFGEESERSSYAPTHEEIAHRAYQYWQSRGGGDGSPEDDWYRAEQDLYAENGPRGQQVRSAAASV